MFYLLGGTVVALTLFVMFRGQQSKDEYRITGEYSYWKIQNFDRDFPDIIVNEKKLNGRSLGKMEINTRGSVRLGLDCIYSDESYNDKRMEVLSYELP